MPVETLKNFVHLLRDSDNDYKDEIRLEQLRREIVEKMRHNKTLEVDVNKLELKLGLLIKNKITLDEIDRERRNHATFGSMSVRGSMDRSRMHSAGAVSIGSNDPFALSTLDAAAARKLEGYQELFYLLQTRPEYLSRLFALFDENAIESNRREVIERTTLILFGYAQQEREEFLLVKLLQRCIADSLYSIGSLRDFETMSPTWYRTAMNYLRGPKERAYLINTFGPIVKLVESRPRLDPNPLHIYLEFINREEERTGLVSQRPRNVTHTQAINDPDTKAEYIKRA